MRRQSALRGAAGALAAAVAASVAALVAPVGAAQALTPVTIWVAGDSTVANDSGNGITGWARMLSGYLGPDATIQNKALAGRSIQTWMYEGGVSSSMGGNGECSLTSTTPSTRYQAVLDGMKAGDWFLIDFGINDGDPTCPRHVGTARYQQLMESLVRDATSRGAHALLLTPTSGMSCSGNVAVANRGFGDAVRAAGSSTSSPVIDLTTLSVNLYNQLRLCPNDGDYTAGALGAFFVDRTHFEAAGATQIAGLVAKALRDQGIALAAYLASSSSTSTTTSTPSSGVPLVHSSGLCLQPSGSAVSGAALVLGACGSSPALWQFSSSGDVRAAGQAICFDAYGKGTTPGTKVVLWTCNGGANQQFGWASGAIRGNGSGLCVAPSGSAVAGASVVLDTCSGSSAQAWGTVVTSTTSTTTTTTTTSSSTTTTTTKSTTKSTKTKSTKTKKTKTKKTKTKTTKKTKTRTAGLTPLTVW